MPKEPTSTINSPRNDDLRIELKRLVSILENTDLDQKEYRKAVKSVRKTTDMIEKLNGISSQPG